MKKLAPQLRLPKALEQSQSKRQLELSREVLKELTVDERSRIAGGSNGCSGGGVPSFSATL